MFLNLVGVAGFVLLKIVEKLRAVSMPTNDSELKHIVETSSNFWDKWEWAHRGKFLFAVHCCIHCTSYYSYFTCAPFHISGGVPRTLICDSLGAIGQKGRGAWKRNGVLPINGCLTFDAVVKWNRTFPYFVSNSNCNTSKTRTRMPPRKKPNF